MTDAYFTGQKLFFGWRHHSIFLARRTYLWKFHAQSKAGSWETKNMFKTQNFCSEKSFQTDEKWQKYLIVKNIWGISGKKWQLLLILYGFHIQKCWCENNWSLILLLNVCINIVSLSGTSVVKSITALLKL